MMKVLMCVLISNRPMSGKFYGGDPCNGCPLYEVCDAGECGRRYDLKDDMGKLDGFWSPKVTKVFYINR